MLMPLGYRTYLGLKRKGENSMFGKRVRPEAVYGRDPQNPGDKAKAVLLELQRPFSKCRGSRVARLHTPIVRRIQGPGAAPEKDIATGQGGSEPPQGLERSAYVALLRLSRPEDGIAYGARALWRRNLHSSRGSHAPSRRAGKPLTRQREVGVCRFSVNGRFA